MAVGDKAVDPVALHGAATGIRSLITSSNELVAMSLVTGECHICKSDKGRFKMFCDDGEGGIVMKWVQVCDDGHGLIDLEYTVDPDSPPEQDDKKGMGMDVGKGKKGLGKGKAAGAAEDMMNIKVFKKPNGKLFFMEKGKTFNPSFRFLTATWTSETSDLKPAVTVWRFNQPQFGAKTFFSVSHFRDALQMQISDKRDHTWVSRNWQAWISNASHATNTDEDKLAVHRSAESVAVIKKKEGSDEKPIHGKECMPDWAMSFVVLMMTLVYWHLKGVKDIGAREMQRPKNLAKLLVNDLLVLDKHYLIPVDVNLGKNKQMSPSCIFEWASTMSVAGTIFLELVGCMVMNVFVVGKTMTWLGRALNSRSSFLFLLLLPRDSKYVK